ncbi:MAG: formylglycine-generating enzyme family protein [Rhodospirillales bacterium]|nr:formylglycine-generating enzyme family protein [Rhodospirillales bacterium]
MRPCLLALLLLGVPTAGKATPAADLVAVPGGLLHQGDSKGEADEVLRDVEIAAFRMMRREVTNADFARFAAATGHVSDPERKGWGWVWTGRWRKTAGADWRHPAGPDSTIEGLEDHPVVQVSQADAAAFCAWHGLRLPGDAEWEYAARGTGRRRYPWGDQPPDQSGMRRANFGTVKCCAPDTSDGFARTAPVGRYPAGASPFGLLDMAGNVWEWTSEEHPGEPGEFAIRGGGWGNNPYCLRVSYRHANPPDIGLDMVGFRCAGEAGR